MGKPPKTRPAGDIGAPVITAAMMAINPVATKGWLDIMSESARFLTNRLQQDLSTQKAMLACKNPAELMQVQSEFCKTAFEQYTGEFTRLCQMMSKATIEAMDDARSGHARSYDDIPL